MSTSSSSDIVLPMIQSHNGKSYTAGVVRKKSTPKIISTRRHFELYGRGDQRLVSKICLKLYSLLNQKTHNSCITV